MRLTQEFISGTQSRPEEDMYTMPFLSKGGRRNDINVSKLS